MSFAFPKNAPSASYNLYSLYIYLQEQIPELQYVTIIDNEEETFEVALPLTNLTDKNSQELAEPFYEEVQKKKRCLGYQGLDSMKRILDDSALYQKLKHRQRRRASV